MRYHLTIEEKFDLPTTTTGVDDVECEDDGDGVAHGDTVMKMKRNDSSEVCIATYHHHYLRSDRFIQHYIEGRHTALESSVVEYSVCLDVEMCINCINS